MELSIREKLFSGGMWVSGGKIFGLVSRLALNAFLARLLSPDDLGIYFLIYSLMSFSMLFSLLGMDRSIVRIVSESLALDQPGRAWTAVKYVLQLGFISSIIVAVLLVSGVGQFLSVKLFASESMRDIIYLPAAWVVIGTLQMLVVESFRGYHDIRFATLFDSLTANVISATALGVIYLKFGKIDLSHAILTVMTAHAVNLTLSFTFLMFKISGGRQEKKSARFSRSELMKTSRVLYFTGFSLYFMEIGPLWLLAYFSNKESVAVYGAMMRLIVLITSTLGIIKMIILPMIRHLYTIKDFKKMERVLRTTATVAGIPSIIGLLIVILFGKSIITAIYGGHYAVGYSTLVILSTAHLVNVLTGTPGVLLVMASKENYLLLISLISSVIGICVSYLLVARFDYLGVAIGAGVGIILQNTLMALYSLKKLRINTLMDLREIAVIAGAVKDELNLFLGRNKKTKVYFGITKEK